MAGTSNLTLTTNEKIGLISNFSTMLTAGIPILETVDSLLEDAKGNNRKLLQSLRDDLIQGKRVSTTFARFPGVFDKVTVNIIKASEEAGTLDVALRDLKDNIRKEVEFADRVKGAFIYPVMIFAVFIGVMLLILGFVVPRISSVFSRLNVPLPLPTRIMIAMSDILITYTIQLSIGTVLGCIGLYFFIKSNRRVFLQIFYTLPLISDLARLIDLTRFSRSLYLLLNSGIPITGALELAQEVVTGRKIERAINHAREMVLAGKRLSDGFKEKKNIFPGIMIKISEAGEKSGSLDKSMQDISEYLDYQVSNTLKTLTTLLEPVMLIFVGGLIGGMMLSIIAPIYSIISQIGGS